jgi:hypothetical protein
LDSSGFFLLPNMKNFTKKTLIAMGEYYINNDNQHQKNEKVHSI